MSEILRWGRQLQACRVSRISDGDGQTAGGANARLCAKQGQRTWRARSAGTMMRSFKLLIAAIVVVSNVSTAQSADCSFWNFVCLWNKSRDNATAGVEKGYSAKDLGLPDSSQSAGQTLKVDPSLTEKLLGTGQVLEPSNNNQVGNAPSNDPFGSKAHAVGSPSAPGSDNSGLQNSQSTRTLVPCGDGSSAVCYRNADGTIARSDGGSTFRPSPNASSLNNVSSPQTTSTSPKQSGSPPDNSGQQVRTLVPCGDGSSAVCYREPNGTISRTQSGPVTTPSPPTQSAATSAQPHLGAGPVGTIANGGLVVSPSSVGKPTAVGTAIPIGTPGGISLSAAAAQAIPIDLDVEGVSYRDGRVIFSGKSGSSHTLDAALVMTAFRAACEPGDPSFSLDADNGAAWLDEGNKASERLWEVVRRDIGWNRAIKADRRSVRSRSLEMHAIWGRRDYPRIWNGIAASYPNLYSRLVFRPTWLHETRFGEVMYRADVLLKELASGVSVLEPGSLRASKVESYVSELSRNNGKTLLGGLRNEPPLTEQRGSRLWFDIAPRSGDAGAAQDVLLPGSAADRDLLAVLRQHRFMHADRLAPLRAHQIARDGNTLDLSNVHPTMFVRRHDIARGVDIPTKDPTLDALADSINNSIEKYEAAYKELQTLAEVVRAYVAAVHIVGIERGVCERLRITPLFESEKAARPLPDTHPSEVMIATARYTFGDGRRRVRGLEALSTLVQGGVGIAGKSYLTSAITTATTRVTRSLNEESSRPVSTGNWTGADGRRYIAFTLASSEPVAQSAPNYERPIPIPTVTIRPQSSAGRSDDYNLCLVIHGLTTARPNYCDDGGKRYYRP